MYQTTHNGIQYCFYDDHLTINGAPLRYVGMENIRHRSGDSPAFVFKYGDRQFALPYPPAELQQILPYMKLASETVPEPDPVIYETLEEVPSTPDPVSSDPVPAEPSVPEPVSAEPVYIDPEPARSIPQPGPASPAAGAAKKGSKKKGCLILVIILVALLVALGACLSGGGDTTDDSDSDYDQPATTEETTEPTTTEPDPAADLNTEERNAYQKALDQFAIRSNPLLWSCGCSPDTLCRMTRVFIIYHSFIFFTSLADKYTVLFSLM